MASQSFTITGSKGSEHFQVAGPEENIQKFSLVFLSLFPDMVDLEQMVIRPGIITPELRTVVEAFVAEYSDKLPQLNRVPALLRKFEDNEVFFVFPFIEMPQLDSFMVHSAIDSLNSRKDHNEEFKKLLDLFGDVINDYKLGTYGFVRSAIGEVDRSKRVCRFCSNARVPLNFNQRAHAISEGLGNKTIVLYDECDGCNAEFSKDTEQDIIEFYSFFRAVHGIKGKGGLKEYKGKNFEISRKNGQLTIAYYSDEENPKDPKPEKQLDITLISNREISKQNIYRCLCKYFLSVINAEYLQFFTGAIDWVNGKFDADKLPNVIRFNYYGWFKEQPTMTTYIRTTENRALPFAIGEFQFGFTKTIFIVPFSSQDDFDYTDKKDFDRFMQKFKHLNIASGARFDNLSDSKKRTFQINLNIKSSGLNEDFPANDSNIPPSA